MKFPIDMKPARVVKALSKLGFVFERQTSSSHTILKHSDGRSICIPNHKRLKMSTITKELRNCGVDKQSFLRYYK